MSQIIGVVFLLFVTFAYPVSLSAQVRGTPAAPAPAPPPPAQTQQQPQRGTAPATTPQTPPAAARGQRPAPKPPTPMTLRQVLESLSSLKNTARVEDLVSKAGVQFQATPGVLDILKEFGAGPKLLAMIPQPPPP